MLSTESILMAVFGFVVLYGGLAFFVRIALKKGHVHDPNGPMRKG